MVAERVSRSRSLSAQPVVARPANAAAYDAIEAPPTDVATAYVDHSNAPLPPQRVSVTAPRGSRAGMSLHVEVNGVQSQVLIPEGVNEGDTFTAEARFPGP